MGKIKNLSIKKTIVLYIAISLVFNFFLSASIMKWATRYQENIWSGYIEQGYGGQGADRMAKGDPSLRVERVSNMVMTDNDVRLSELCDFIQTWTVLILSMTGCILAIFLFYRHKIKIPLEELTNGSRMISRNDLEFNIEYKSQDELGILCSEFERMRGQLSENNKKLWTMVEQEKELRSAIAHDIRSPLAVLKGYQEMLLEFIPEEQLDQDKVIEILEAGMGQIDRLDVFVDTMRRLSRLEDRKLYYQDISLVDLADQLRQTAEMMCKKTGKELTLTNQLPVQIVQLDNTVISEVFENLLSNALRYAKIEVRIEVSLRADYLQIQMKDDGAGFLVDEETATNVYYHNNPTDDLNHFGLGLYLCRIYCEKHGGKLLLGNQVSGGAYVKARFKI